MSDALDTEGAVEKLSKEAGILLVMLLAGGVALWFGWDQISAVFESQQKLQRAVEEISKQESVIYEYGSRISELEKKNMGTEVDLMLLRKDTDSNTYFSTNWPRGTIGALPDDAIQNTKIEYIEKQIDQLRLKISDMPCE
tara:strand:- start:14927 stop:15346 length:420 start_codon:yes stop_codon:yes gene_type:complete